MGVASIYGLQLGLRGWRECGLTPRSSGAPTAGHQARAGGTPYIFTGPGLASCRRRPLSSNVRLPKLPHFHPSSVLLMRQHTFMSQN